MFHRTWLCQILRRFRRVFTWLNLSKIHSSHWFKLGVRASCDTNRVIIWTEHVFAMATGRHSVVNQELQDNALAFFRIWVSKWDVLGQAHSAFKISFYAAEAIRPVTAVMPSYSFRTNILAVVYACLCKLVIPFKFWDGLHLAHHLNGFVVSGNSFLGP